MWALLGFWLDMIFVSLGLRPPLEVGVLGSGDFCWWLVGPAIRASVLVDGVFFGGFVCEGNDEKLLAVFEIILSQTQADTYRKCYSGGNKMREIQRKVVVIGAGSVGATYCYALMQTGLADEIAIVDLDSERVEGEVMDLSHGLPFVRPVSIYAGEYSDCADANLIVLTAGAKQRSGESRLDLISRNTEIVRSICAEIGRQKSDAVLVVVTNPVDLLTHAAIDELNWPRGKVIGSGTVLDSSRFRYMLSSHCGLDARNVHAYILGEHGDSEVAAWSISHISGLGISEYCRSCGVCDSAVEHERIEDRVRDSAYHIIDYKGATYYAIGLSLVRISEAIIRDEKSVLTVSTLLDGEYGISGVCLSVPCVVGREGVRFIIEAKLSNEEQDGLERSANALKEMFKQTQGTRMQSSRQV